MNKTTKILLTLCIVNLLGLGIFVGWYSYDQSQIKKDRQEAYRAFWEWDSTSREAKRIWETEEKWQDEAFKDSVRKKLNMQSVIPLWLLPTIPDLNSEVATLIIGMLMAAIAGLVTAVVFMFKVLVRMMTKTIETNVAIKGSIDVLSAKIK
jgi:hypothetical protein